MAKTISELQQLMVVQLKERGFYPKESTEILLRLGEEVGEVMEAIREGKNNQELSHEMVDVLWNLLRLAEFKGIDMEQAFIEKLAINNNRPLLKSVTDISENA